jgi:glycosyltransferase involved in cell wall biosynthesis
VGLAKAFESISDIFYGLLQQYERMDRIALSMMIKGPLSLATLGAAIYLSGDLLLGVCGLAAAWLLLLLVYDARNGASLLKVASRAKHPAVDFRSALARRLQLSWRPRVLVTLTLLALPVGIVMALVSFNTNIPLYFIEHHLGTWDLGIFAAVGYPLAAGTTVVNALGQSAAPTLARYYADSDYRAFSSLIGKLRVPGQIGACVERHIRKQGRPYGVEVVGDPYDTFAPKTVRHPLRPLFRWFFPRRLRRMCSRACAAAYVTRHALQRRYPPAPHAFATHYSSVELPLAAFAKVPRAPTLVDTAKLVFVGTMAQLYKGPDLLLDAIGQCVRYGRKIELVLVGGGQFQGELESRAVALGLGDCAQFRGHLTTPEAVRAELDQAHLFVLPSRQEGLPRAMIEAMARALPCLGSTVGGVPELLPAEDLVPPDDALALANKICEVLADPVRMARMSARNLEKAREYSQAPAQRRQAFYCHVKAQTQAWHEANGPSFTAASAEVSRREC